MACRFYGPQRGHNVVGQPGPRFGHVVGLVLGWFQVGSCAWERIAELSPLNSVLALKPGAQDWSSDQELSPAAPLGAHLWSSAKQLPPRSPPRSSEMELKSGPPPRSSALELGPGTPHSSPRPNYEPKNKLYVAATSQHGVLRCEHVATTCVAPTATATWPQRTLRRN